MTTVVAEMSMSLDGFVADRSDGLEHLFGWYFNGEVEVPTPASSMTFRTSAASAGYLREGARGRQSPRRRAAAVRHRPGLGRESSNGGAGLRRDAHRPRGLAPRGRPVYLRHRRRRECAVAQAKAVAGDDGIVAVASPKVAQQCLDAGLLDEVRVNLVPVLLGEGIRYFDNLTKAPRLLADPRVIEGTGVTHLCYPIIASG